MVPWNAKNRILLQARLVFMKIFFPKCWFYHRKRFLCRKFDHVIILLATCWMLIFEHAFFDLISWDIRRYVYFFFTVPQIMVSFVKYWKHQKKSTNEIKFEIIVTILKCFVRSNFNFLVISRIILVASFALTIWMWMFQSTNMILRLRYH